MTDLAPDSWPLEIRNRFVFGPVPSEVPGLLHPLIGKWTFILSMSSPDFHYKDIYIKTDRTVVVRLEGADSHDAELQETLQNMMEELTTAYNLKEGSHDKLRTRSLAR